MRGFDRRANSRGPRERLCPRPVLGDVTHQPVSRVIDIIRHLNGESAALRELGYEPTPNPVRRNGDRVRLYLKATDTADQSGCAGEGVPTDQHQQGSK